MDRSLFVLEFIELLCKELPPRLEKESKELEFLKRTRIVVDSRIDHIVKGIENAEKRDN